MFFYFRNKWKEIYHTRVKSLFINHRLWKTGNESRYIFWGRKFHDRVCITIAGIWLESWQMSYWFTVYSFTSAGISGTLISRDERTEGWGVGGVVRSTVSFAARTPSTITWSGSRYVSAKRVTYTVWNLQKMWWGPYRSRLHDLHGYRGVRWGEATLPDIRNRSSSSNDLVYPTSLMRK